MATRTVFSDDNSEMDCYLNDNGKVFISIGQPGEDIINSGFITLDKSDVSLLIKVLVDLEKEMTE